MPIRPWKHLAAALWLLAGASSSAERYRFVVMGDSRPEYGDPVPVTATFTEIIRQVNVMSPAPEMVIHTGDIIIGSTTDEEFLVSQFDAFGAAIQTLRPPLLIAVGNHEDYDTVSQRIYRERFGDLFFSRTIRGSSFIFLDNVSHSPKRYGMFGDDQIAWLETELKKAAGAVHRFVSFHVPITASKFEAWNEVSADVRERLHAVFVRHRVTAVFQGHVHGYDETVRDGVRYFITGGGGADLDMPDEKHHYLVVDVDGDHVTYAVRDVAPGQRAAAPEKPVLAAVRVRGGSIVNWSQGVSGWTPWNIHVSVTGTGGRKTGTRGLRMAFQAARSLWPMVSWAPDRPLDLSAVRGLRVHARLVPEQIPLGATLAVKLTLGGWTSSGLPIKPGEWTRLDFVFADPVWKGRGAGEKDPARKMAAADLGSVPDLSLAVDIREPDADWWQVTSRAAVELSDLRAY